MQILALIPFYHQLNISDLLVYALTKLFSLGGFLRPSHLTCVVPSAIRTYLLPLRVSWVTINSLYCFGSLLKNLTNKSKEGCFSLVLGFLLESVTLAGDCEVLSEILLWDQLTGIFVVWLVGWFIG